MLERFFTAPEQSYFLFGPRGTGKSTWLKVRYPEALVIDLLNPEVFRTFSAHPEYLYERIATHNLEQPIVIDEVQKVPELLSVVHDAMESQKALQFILTGSSSRKLKRTGVDLLAGRAVVRKLHPFMAQEMGDRFNLEDALRFGLVPLVVESSKPRDTLNAYIGLYLKEEVQAEGLIRNIGDFARFLEVLSFSHGSILNLSSIARECQVSRKVVEGYLSILEDLLLGYQIPVFTRRAKRDLISSPKFYYFDAGVYRSLRPRGFLDTDAEINGAGLEGLVAQHLMAWNDYQEYAPNKIYYWRTKHGVEVDFVVYGENCFCAIEVKNSKIIHPQDLRGLATFQMDYPEAKVMLLYRGKEKFKRKNILCMPIEEFLLNLSPKGGGIKLS